jgi:site-specific recombinase XerD
MMNWAVGREYIERTPFRRGTESLIRKLRESDHRRRRLSENEERGLTPECGEQFRRINLHWHDLRHEYASRLVERGVPLAQVRDLLGHASITTTERYDNQKLEKSPGRGHAT